MQREVYGRRAAEAAGITPEAMQLEIKKAYRKARAIEQKKQESQDLDIARQRAPKSRAIRYDNLRSDVYKRQAQRILKSCRNKRILTAKDGRCPSFA